MNVPLSPRQRQVVVLLRQGLTEDQVCTELGMSRQQFVTLAKEAYRRLELPNPVEHRDGPPRLEPGLARIADLEVQRLRGHREDPRAVDAMDHLLDTMFELGREAA